MGMSCSDALLLLQKDELRRLLAVKEKQQEESVRTFEALKAKLRFYEVRPSSGEGGVPFWPSCTELKGFWKT